MHSQRPVISGIHQQGHNFSTQKNLKAKCKKSPPNLEDRKALATAPVA